MLDLSLGHDLALLNAIEATFQLFQPALKLLIFCIEKLVFVLCLAELLLLHEPVCAELRLNLLLELTVLKL